MLAAQPSPRSDSRRRHLQMAVAATLIGATAVYLAGPLREQPREYGSLRAPSGHDLQVEIARSSEQRSRGLSERAPIEAGGLLLVWPDAGDHPIWMNDMRFPLDLLWFDGDYRVLAIESDARPCNATPCPILRPQQAERSVMVLELPSGQAARHLIAVGATLAPTRPEYLDRIVREVRVEHGLDGVE